MLRRVWEWLWKSQDRPRSITRGQWEALLDRIDALERVVKGVTWEWQDTQSRLLKAMARLQGLLKKGVQQEEPSEPTDPNQLPLGIEPPRGVQTAVNNRFRRF
jgi:hypothetical protein